MLRRDHATPFTAEAKSQVGLPDNAPALVYLSEKKWELLASRGGLKGSQRDNPVLLAKVIERMIEKDMGL